MKPTRSIPCLALLALVCVFVLSAGKLAAQHQVPQMPSAWKQRTLRIPPGYEMLVPSDVFIGFRQHVSGNIWLAKARMAPGSSAQEADAAYESQAGMHNTIHRALMFRGSDTLGKISIGWVAFVRVADPMPIQAPNFPREAAGFAYGAASLPEALEFAATQAIESFRRAGGGRFETLIVEAGVSAKPDYELYRRNGTTSNRSALPFAMLTYYPTMQGDAARWGYPAQFPQEPKDLVRWLLAPEQRARAYTSGNGKQWYGTWFDGHNLPRPGMAPPVFLTGLQDADYRPDASLSPAERQQRDDTAKLALELMERSRQVPSAGSAALPLLLEAARLGHVQAQFTLGTHLLDRAKTDDDRMNGLSWLGAAATQGSVPAKHTLIENLMAQENLDPDRAIREMESLANRGELNQFSALAWVHREGRLGLAPNPAKAVDYLERGVSFTGPTGKTEGYRNWLMDDLAAACFAGDGTAQNRARAAQLLRDSGMEGQSQASPGDIFRAYFYATGEHGFPCDPEKAAKLLDNVLDEWRYYERSRQAIRTTVNAALAASSAAADTKR